MSCLSGTGKNFNIVQTQKRRSVPRLTLEKRAAALIVVRQPYFCLNFYSTFSWILKVFPLIFVVIFAFPVFLA